MLKKFKKFLRRAVKTKVKKLVKSDQTFANNFLSFKLFQNPFSPACLSRRDASFSRSLYTKNVYGLAVRDEKPSKNDQKKNFSGSTLSPNLGINF